MKKNYFANVVPNYNKSLSEIVLTLIFLFTLPCVSFGQSLYADIWVSGDTVSAYANMTGGYGMSHIDTTFVNLTSPAGGAFGSGGTYASASLPVVDGLFYLTASFDSYCSEAGVSYGGGSISIQKQVCVDECAACHLVRTQQTTSAYITAGACELAAVAIYEAKVQDCNNQNYCKPNHADYNPQQCDECKNTAYQILGIGTAACALNLARDLNNRTNCEAMKKDVNCILVQCYNP